MSSHYTAQQAHLNQRPQVPNPQNVMQTPHGWQQPTLFCQQESMVSQQQTPNGTLIDIQQTGYPPMNYVYQGYPNQYYDTHAYQFQQHPYGVYPNQMPQSGIHVQNQMAGQIPLQPPREEKKKRILQIINPETKDVINKDFVERDEKEKESKPTPVPVPVPAPVPQLTAEQKDQKKNEIVSKFNQQVMNRAYNDDQSKLAAAQPPRPSPQPSPAKPAVVKVEPEKKDEPAIKPPVSSAEVTPERIAEKESTPEIDTSVEEEPKAEEKKDDSDEKPKNVYRPPVIRERDTSEPVANGTEPTEVNGIQEEGPGSRVATPDKEAENTEKLLSLQTKAEELYKKESEAIEKREYSSELIYFVREVVSLYKKTPTPCDESMLKERDLHIEGMPQTSQNRPKFSGGGHPGVYNFNPQWAPGQNSGGLKRAPYTGRHSENTRNGRKKGSITGRASLDRSARNPPPQPLDNLRKAENAWKPKRRDGGAIDDEDLRYEMSRKEIRSIFNKITPSTYDDLRDEFLNLNVDSDTKLQKIAIDLVFDKAVEEPKFCTLYTKICRAQIDATGKGEDSFYRALVQKAQSTFQGSGEIVQQIAEVKKELDELPEEGDEKKRQDIQERLELLEAKEKRVLLGNIKFISHLYVAGILVDIVVVSCVGALYESYMDKKDETFLQYGIELLEFVSGTYFTKHKLSADEKKDNQVVMFMDWLPTIKQAVSSKIKFMIMNFEDFRKGGFVKEEKGPKTIAQLHQDIKKEEEKNKNERLQYDAMKEKEKERNRPRAGYGGRPSIERVDKEKMRAKAFAATINTGSAQKTGSIRLATAKQTLGRTGGLVSYYKQVNDKKEESVATTEAAPPAQPEEVDDGWTIAGGKNAVSTARIPSLERKSSNTPTPNGSEPNSTAGSRSASEAPPS